MDFDTDNPQWQELLAAEPYWIARAMQEQGSRFYRALGLALEASDAMNRRLIYRTWPEPIWDFYQRGLQLAAQENQGAAAGYGGVDRERQKQG